MFSTDSIQQHTTHSFKQFAARATTAARIANSNTIVATIKSLPAIAPTITTAIKRGNLL